MVSTNNNNDNNDLALQWQEAKDAYTSALATHLEVMEDYTWFALNDAYDRVLGDSGQDLVFYEEAQMTMEGGELGGGGMRADCGWPIRDPGSELTYDEFICLEEEVPWYDSYEEWEASDTYPHNFCWLDKFEEFSMLVYR